ncbi:hypothetical protein J4573_06380 [Actinomadura barringtoniae]|uniref:Secreted protein n=1 Tax=Actinomadura barringtoniae TaxID=1427535 RepID=A0A939T3I1_9ACTN|nr:hypothetical protein [Actinomadura barringtoniae]MBO2446709.1 hypothetical protein [Actinomadura barringtoniae]
MLPPTRTVLFGMALGAAGVMTAVSAAPSATAAPRETTTAAPGATAAPTATAAAASPGDTSPLSGVSFKLKPSPVSPAALAELDQMAANPARGMKRQDGLAPAAADAKRKFTWKKSCPSGAQSAIKALDAKVTLAGWCFATSEDAGTGSDQNKKQWIPQGIAYSKTSQLNGIALSWYHRVNKGGKWVTDQGRITVGPSPKAYKAGAYDPVTLAVPTATASGKLVAKEVVPPQPPGGDASAQGTAESTQHNGGVALVGNYLYVAGTSEVRVFDVRRTYQVPTGKDILGVGSDGKFYAHNAKYVLFQTNKFTPENAGSCPAESKPPSATSKDLCFSTVFYDQTTSPGSLLVSEYKAKGGVTSSRPLRVARWSLNADGSLKTDASGKAVSQVVYKTNLLHVQGVAGYHSGTGDTIYYNTSSSAPAIFSDRDSDGKAPFKLVGTIGAESFAYEPVSSGGGRLWSVTEQPGKRMLYYTYRKDMQRSGMP